MAKNKTVPTNENVYDFIEKTVDNDQKKTDSYALIDIMAKITGQKPYMWGPSIIGFGNYHYKYKSGHEGDAPILGFSPRKTAISLYVFTGLDKHKHLLENLGTYKIGKSCIYVKTLNQLNMEVFNNLMIKTVDYINQKFPPLNQ